MPTVAQMLLALSIVLLTGCGRVSGMTDLVRERFGGADDATATDAPAPVAEVPDVSGAASWDGVPSLGGVWVAHPGVDAPLRVRIARQEGGRSVEGWLFGRDADEDGPPLQVSSEAAGALGLAAGETVELVVQPLDGEPPADEG